MKPISFAKEAIWLTCIVLFWLPALIAEPDLKVAEVTAYLEEIMDPADIPGMSIVLIVDGQEQIFHYGYADREAGRKVGDQTLFEIGSCTKAFTALAFSIFQKEYALSLGENVSDYLPWFHVYYEDEETGEQVDAQINLRQLLHHTSGIPWNTIAGIPPSQATNALGQTVRTLIGQKLREKPGKAYEYATLNYDILALIIETTTGQSFESYLQEKVLDPLQLPHTTIGTAQNETLLAQGYKIGYFTPRAYEAPVYKGNNAAGYVISNASDIARWLKFQMGLVESALYPLAALTHERDPSVPLHDMSAYGGGWHIALDGTGEIFHGGLNPNFSSYIVFRPADKMGVAVLTNSNSTYTPLIGNKLMKLLAGEKIEREVDPGDRGDTTYSIISFLILFYMLVVLGLMVWALRDAALGKRKFERPCFSKLGQFVKGLVLIAPFLAGLYLLPEAIAGFTWESILVWTPISLTLMIGCMLVAIALSYLAYWVNLHFPEENIYKRKAPSILLLSILSGLANMAVIVLVTSSFNVREGIGHLIFYYVLAIGIYLLGRLYVQTHLIRFTIGLIYELRVKLIDKIFSTAYRNFEKIDRGRVYTALNDDVNTLGRSTNLVVTLITSIITAVAAFLYLATIAFWATFLTIFLIVSLASIYAFVSQRTNPYFEEARDERNIFMRLLNGLIDGYKELSLQIGKKLEYKTDITESAARLKDKLTIADTRFLHAFLVGESLLVVLLGFIAFGIPQMFPNIQLHIALSFIIVLLYLIGPINSILGAVPAVMQIKIAWNRVNGFINEIPATIDLSHVSSAPLQEVDSITARDIRFSYDSAESDRNFSVGPINFEAYAGEIIFIIGGNGSGKTTLSKLLTGLYEPTEGELMINGEALKSAEISEYFSTAFTPPYLFEKLYNIDLEAKQLETQKYLKLLKLDDKVEIDIEKYSTIDLSGGQRKRLALLQCYLENRPIYLFDEWAADQDPEFRKFFYHTLLPEMKALGKIVIAITHDDHYFHIADRVLKMEQGKLSVVERIPVSQ